MRRLEAIVSLPLGQPSTSAGRALERDLGRAGLAESQELLAAELDQRPELVGQRDLGGRRLGCQRSVGGRELEVVGAVVAAGRREARAARALVDRGGAVGRRGRDRERGRVAVRVGAVERHVGDLDVGQGLEWRVGAGRGDLAGVDADRAVVGGDVVEAVARGRHRERVAALDRERGRSATSSRWVSAAVAARASEGPHERVVGPGVDVAAVGADEHRVLGRSASESRRRRRPPARASRRPLA